MTKISLSILDKNGKVKEEIRKIEESPIPLQVSEKDFVSLSTKNFEYEEGDQISVQTDKTGSFLMVKFDETIDTSLVYIPEGNWTYDISFNKNRSEARPEQRFIGKHHYLSVRVATKEEIIGYRNLALNPHDQKEMSGAYPHAHANVETRDDATFFACNAIDGVYANNSHGAYPFQSWGINQQADAALTIDFGRKVELDKVVFTWRADFPHDSYWTEVTVRFSDGSKETFQTQKTDRPQSFTFSKRQVTSVTFGELIQSDDSSPFPALTQIEFFGCNIL